MKAIVTLLVCLAGCCLVGAPAMAADDLMALFTAAKAGATVTLPAGTYTIEVENLDGTYVKGSSVGPLDPPMRNPGAPEFWNEDESALDSPQSATPITVAPGQNLRDINIILNGTPNRYDNFEDGGTAASRLLSPLRQFPGQHRLHRFGKELEG
jgi:hypothetical protein